MGRGEGPALALALASLNRRYGQGAVRSGGRAELQGQPTGIGSLDLLTGCGGLPRGRISRLRGGDSSGAFDLGLQLAARVSLQLPVVLVDFSLDLDPGLIDAYHGDLDNCWLVRPRSPAEGWSAARALARAGVGLCLVLARDWPRVTPGAAPAALLAALSESGSSALLLGGGPLPAELRERTSLELASRRLGWELSHGDVCGMRLELTVSRSRLAAPGASCRLRLGFPRPYPTQPGPEELAGEGGEEEEAGLGLLLAAGAGG